MKLVECREKEHLNAQAPPLLLCTASPLGTPASYANPVSWSQEGRAGYKERAQGWAGRWDSKATGLESLGECWGLWGPPYGRRGHVLSRVHKGRPSLASSSQQGLCWSPASPLQPCRQSSWAQCSGGRVGRSEHIHSCLTLHVLGMVAPWQCRCGHSAAGRGGGGVWNSRMFLFSTAADSHVASGTISHGDRTVGRSDAKTRPGQAPDTESPPCPCGSPENSQQKQKPRSTSTQSTRICVSQILEVA